VRYFLGRHGAELGNASPSILPEAIDFLAAQPWPGNVRELQNVIKKALLSAQGYTVNLDHVRVALSKTAAAAYSAERPAGEYIDEMLAAARRNELADAYDRVIEATERELFSRAIQQANGNQAKAARWLGITRVTMRTKLIQFGLHQSDNAVGG
jgi:DNA-binding NtrC family response regulator